MTSRTESLPLAAVSAGFAWPRLVLTFVLTLTAVVLFALTFALAYVQLHAGRVLPGVTVAGVSLAGLDRVQAEALLREQLPSLSSGHLTVRFGDDTTRLEYASFGRDYDMALMLDQAFALGREGTQLEQAPEHLRILLRGVAVEPALTWNPDQLAQHIAAAAAPAQYEPIDARIVRENGHFSVVPAVAGQSVEVQQGLEQATFAINNLSGADTSVVVEGVALLPAIATETAQAAVAKIERVTGDSLAVTGGGSSAVIDADRILGWVRLEEQSAGVWNVVVERDPIRQFVEHYALEVDRAAQNASFAFRGGDVVAVAGKTGQAVDVETATNSIVAALEGRANGGGGSGPLSLAMLVVEPDFSYEEAQRLAPRVERLSRWQTNFVPGPMNHNGRNISIPTDKIDGTVVEPGGTFDFWRVVGVPTRDDGYGDGGAIIRGRTVPDGALAGGICSTSTTVFNAALRAGLQMGARKNHYYYINRYPVGLDATVWISAGGARQTMRFTNDMEYPVLVRGINRRGAVIFEIWGIDDGRRVSFSEPRIENRKRAYGVLRYSNNLRPGQRRRVEWPANGFDSWVTRTVRDANGKVIHEDTFFSRYAMIKGVTLVGRSPGDPKHGTEVRVGR